MFQDMLFALCTAVSKLFWFGLLTRLCYIYEIQHCSVGRRILDFEQSQPDCFPVSTLSNLLLALASYLLYRHDMVV